MKFVNQIYPKNAHIWNCQNCYKLLCERQKCRKITVGGDRLMFDPRRSWGPVLECRLMGRPPPGVPPGELAQDGAMRIFGAISVLSDKRRLVIVFATRKKLLLSFADDVEPNHQFPNIPAIVSIDVASVPNSGHSENLIVLEHNS